MPRSHPRRHAAPERLSRSCLVAATLLAASVAPLRGQERPAAPAGPYFYHGLDYGTQRTFNPFSVLLNTGFDVFQFANHDIRFWRYRYRPSFARVGRSLGNPIHTVAAQGWGHFLKTEILPLRFTTEDASWVPNYTLHLIGLGQTYAELDEFYRQHGVPLPKPLAAVTAMTAGVLNEMAEANGGDFPPSAAMVADVYVFNLGGILLFGSDGVRRFFATELRLSDWSAMPMFMSDGTLQDTGQFWAVKAPLPGWKDTRLFVRFGLAGIVGLSHAFAGGSAWSAGVGRTGVHHFIQPRTGIEDIDMDWTAGVFYDRDDALLMSLLWARNTRELLSLSLYPGLLPGPARDVGLWLAVDNDGRPHLGITAGRVAGLGLGYAPISP